MQVFLVIATGIVGNLFKTQGCCTNGPTTEYKTAPT